MPLPRISVITSSYNQGAFIGETIESVLAQEYPNLEHIVVDGMSTDETPDVLARYGHLKVIREPDKGQADAINKGFRRATGDIWCFLNSDDTFLPGALHRVAREIDPGAGRHVVMGRCRFVDEHGRYTGIEHPCHFDSFRRVLEVWKGHFIPQPAVFWTPEVWRKAGPLDVDVAHLDYDLFCRFARYYRFHMIDQPLATYRLHAESKTVGWSEAERLEDSIRLSKRYWGSPFLPRWWRLAVSLSLHRFNRFGRAHEHLRSAQESARQNRTLSSLWHKALYGILVPEAAFCSRLRPLAGRFLQKAQRVCPQTAAYFDYVDVWADGWAGPRLVVEQEAVGDERTLVLSGTVQARYFGRTPFRFTVLIDGEPTGEVELSRDGYFSREIQLPRNLSRGTHAVEIRASAWVAFHQVLRNNDHRPLAWMPARPEAVVFR